MGNKQARPGPEIPVPVQRGSENSQQTLRPNDKLNISLLMPELYSEDYLCFNIIKRAMLFSSVCKQYVPPKIDGITFESIIIRNSQRHHPDIHIMNYIHPFLMYFFDCTIIDSEYNHKTSTTIYTLKNKFENTKQIYDEYFRLFGDTSKEAKFITGNMSIFDLYAHFETPFGRDIMQCKRTAQLKKINCEQIVLL